MNGDRPVNLEAVLAIALEKIGINRMKIDDIAALFLAMTTLAAIPSTSVVIVVTSSITSGFKHGVATAAGILCGDFLFIFLAVFGLSISAKSLSSLSAIEYIGAAYLTWMGIKLWLTNTRSAKIEQHQNYNYLSGFTSGLLVTLADFKAILFYASFFPAFLDLKRITILDLGIILAIALISVGGVKVAYACLAAKARLFIHSSKVIRRMNRLAGTAMICIAILLIANSQ